MPPSCLLSQSSPLSLPFSPSKGLLLKQIPGLCASTDPRSAFIGQQRKVENRQWEEVVPMSHLHTRSTEAVKVSLTLVCVNDLQHPLASHLNAIANNSSFCPEVSWWSVKACCQVFLLDWSCKHLFGPSWHATPVAHQVSFTHVSWKD